MLLRSGRRLWLRLGLALAAMALFLLGYQWGSQRQQSEAAPSPLTGTRISPPSALPHFRLRDARGNVFNQNSLAQGWSLLALADLTKASGQESVRRLIEIHNRVADQAELRKTLRLVLLNISASPDPTHALANLSPALDLVSGDAAEIARLRGVLATPGDPASAIFVVGPGSHLVARFPASESGTSMAEDLKAIVATASSLLPETQ